MEFEPAEIGSHEAQFSIQADNGQVSNGSLWVCMLAFPCRCMSGINISSVDAWLVAGLLHQVTTYTLRASSCEADVALTHCNEQPLQPEHLPLTVVYGGCAPMVTTSKTGMSVSSRLRGFVLVAVCADSFGGWVGGGW